MFTAPNVTVITNVRITASASRASYADGSDYKYLMVLPPLLVQVTTTPNTIKSEATSNVTVHVTYSGAPVPEAIVTMFSSGGSFALGIGLTDANGNCAFVFTAPQTTTQADVDIIANATKTGYIDGQGQTRLTVEPRILVVQVSATPASINSEMPSNVTVHVTYDSTPISNAVVVVSSDLGGSISPANGFTDTNGECIFNFTAPAVTTASNITITAAATKTGYANGTDQTMITVNLGTLVVQVTPNPTEVESRGTSIATVHVTYNNHPVADAAVTISSGINGTFSITTGTTDANGDCTFVFAAPEATEQYGTIITANATKSGYLSGQGETGIIIKPAAAFGISWLIILAIIVVIIIAIVLVLIKLKILVISSKGE
jgi:hypothetical protein